MLIAEAVAAGWELSAQYVAPGVEAVDGAGRVHQLAAGVAERVSDTSTPQGILALALVPTPDPDAVLADASFVVVADRLADPGNLGTILRSAEAAGVDAIALTPGSVDATNPKVVRASAGARFRVPTVTAELAAVSGAGLRLLGSSSHEGRSHLDVEWRGRIALVAGSESHGLGDDAPVDEWVRIEHAGRSESLNVAMAVTVMCFHAMAVRRLS
ncbi:MAG: RNA methyltransferase [Acidimicrobiia bacterium]|nr:RNA methyltransferase [Acidimicrobiia bacterium]